METVKLSRIVLSLKPELYPFLKETELDMCIVLRNGLETLAHHDVLEIVENSIYQQQKDALLH